MVANSMKTTLARTGQVEAKWYVLNAEGLTLGRLATKVARILMGKHKPIYTPHVDTGDFVIVINAEKIRVTGKKMTDKEYDWYTGFHGGRHVYTFEQMLAKHPTEPVSLAVKRMLPKSRLGTQMFTKLKVYAGAEHPHQAQMPEELTL